MLPSTSSKLGALKKNQGEEGVQWGRGMLVNVPKQMSQMALLHFKECAPVPNYSEINA